VPLEPGDIKSSYLLRHKNEPEWCWRKVDGVKKDKHGVPIVLYSGSSVNFRAMFDHWLISKDGGKTWEMCEKEVVS
jgi:hypothetical protein